MRVWVLFVSCFLLLFFKRGRGVGIISRNRLRVGGDPVIVVFICVCLCNRVYCVCK